jgi:hypothetical protein
VIGTYEFPAQTITLPKPCKKICVLWGANNTSIDIYNGTYTTQYGNPQVNGVLVLERGETKAATMGGAGSRNYAFSADGVSVVVGASTYQAGYQTPCLILILE